MATNEKNIGSSPILGNPDKRLVFKLKDGSVTSSKLGDGSITLEKLSEEVMNTIMRYKKDGITVNIYEEGSTSGSDIQAISVNHGIPIGPDNEGIVNIILKKDSGIMILSNILEEDDTLDNPTINLLGQYVYKDYQIFQAVESTEQGTPYFWQDVTDTISNLTVFYCNKDGKFYTFNDGVLRELSINPSSISQINKDITEARTIATNKGSIYNIKKATTAEDSSREVIINTNQISPDIWRAPEGEEIDDNLILDLYVDLATDILYLQVVDMSYGTPYTVTYFRNWEGYGNMPSASALANNNILFWYVNNGILQVCHYNYTTRKLVTTSKSGGGGSGSSDLIGAVETIENDLYGIDGNSDNPGRGSLKKAVQNLQSTAITKILVDGNVAEVIDGIAKVTTKGQQQAATNGKYKATVLNSISPSEISGTSLIIDAMDVETVDGSIIIQQSRWEGGGAPYLVMGLNSHKILLCDGEAGADGVLYYSAWDGVDGEFPSSEEIINNTIFRYIYKGNSFYVTYNGTTTDSINYGLYIDSTTSRLYLKFDDVYYLNWEACGNISSNEDIADSDDLIQYKVVSTTYLASYDATTHVISPISGGGSSQAIAQIDSSQNPVQSATLQREFNIIDGKIADIESNLGISKGNSSFNLLSDSDEAFATFDYSKGNLGCFIPKVAPEDIAAADVDTIYTVPLPYGFKSVDLIPVKTSASQDMGSTPLYMVSDVAAGLETGTGKGASNRTKFIAMLEDPKCIGLRITGGKHFEMQCVSPSSGVAATKATAIELPRDFIIYGANELSSAIGGFIAHGGILFYTEKSLYLNRVYLENNSYNGKVSIYIADEKGIDQLQVIRCKFTSIGVEDSAVVGNIYPKGYFMSIVSPNERPYKLFEGEDETTAYKLRDKNVVRTVLTTNNAEEGEYPAYINHIYISGNDFEGTNIFNAVNCRVVKSCRFTNNTFRNCPSSAIVMNVRNMDSSNNSSGRIDGTTRNPYAQKRFYDNIMAAMACPRYFVGNTFSGLYDVDEDTGKTFMHINKQVHGRGNDYYYTPMILEGSPSYILHNTIKDFISGNIYKWDSDNSTFYRRSIETYDAYASSLQVYFENNTVSNIGGTYYGGICKGKNLGAGALYANSFTDSHGNELSSSRNGIGGGCITFPFVRHYKGNTYSMDVDYFIESWKYYITKTYGSEAALPELLTTEQRNTYLTTNTTASKAALETDLDVATNNTINAYINEGVFTKILGVKFCNESVVNGRSYNNEVNHPILSEYVFSNNIVKAENGYISGGYVTGGTWREGDDWPTNKCIINNNKFIAAVFSHDTKDDRPDPISGTYDKTEYLFRIKLLRLEPDYTLSGLEVRNNEFIYSSNMDTSYARKGIRFVSNRYAPNANADTPQKGSYSSGDTRYIKENIVSLPYEKKDSVARIVITRTPFNTVFDYYSIATIEDTQIKNIDDNIQKQIGDLSDDVKSLNNILNGEDLAEIPLVKPVNPQERDKYKVEENGTIKVYTCKEPGSYARVSLYPEKNVSSTNQIVNLESLSIPLSSEEENSLDADQIAAVLTALGSPTTEDDVPITTYDVGVNDQSNIVNLLKEVLKACDYIDITDTYTTTQQRKDGPIHAGDFDVYSDSSNTYFIRIIPKYAADSTSYIADNAPQELRKILYTPYGIAYTRSGSSYIYLTSIAGEDPDWGTPVDAVNLQGDVTSLKTNTGLNRTIINNLLAQLNIVRKEQDPSAIDLVINDDGTITEEQDS